MSAGECRLYLVSNNEVYTFNIFRRSSPNRHSRDVLHRNRGLQQRRTEHFKSSAEAREEQKRRLKNDMCAAG